MQRKRRLLFSSFGVPISLSYPRDLEESVRTILPPARTRLPSKVTPKRFRLERQGRSLFRFILDDDEEDPIVEGADRAVILDILDSYIRQHIASEAPEHVFVHAGAVAVDGVALLLPAPTMAGKSTLVAALVRAGATYLSDEYAVLGADGSVLAYPRMISLRQLEAGSATEVDPESLGRIDGGGARPVGVVALTEHQPGATWAPERLTTGVGAMRVFANTVTPSTRPERALGAIRRALEGAIILEGPRGEASGLAPALIAEARERATYTRRA